MKKLRKQYEKNTKKIRPETPKIYEKNTVLITIYENNTVCTIIMEIMRFVLCFMEIKQFLYDFYYS